MKFPLSKPDSVEMEYHIKACQYVLESVISRGIPGAVAEFGVHAGDNLVPICQLMQHRGWADRTVYAFDTFAGLPFGEDNPDGPNLEAGECCTPYDVLAKRLDDEGVSKMVSPVPGMVEHTLPVWLGQDLAFSFIDLDLESSCRLALDWVTLRTSKGGIFGIHDYGHPKIPGPEKICHELESSSKEWRRFGPILGNACFFERI